MSLIPEPAPNRPDPDVPPKKESALEEAARQQFGLNVWDRTALYHETAEAASDTTLPFWAVLMLSGAIATLGLALNATAVVIGAMLIAPLLGPVLGLGMALAVGDGRLAAQTTLTILLGTLGVIAVSALLTIILPFQSITDEIAARTRPTTLDLAIAVASGLAGAVVTLTREKRLSAAIPGVAIAVALIPPLGVTGFGIGIGWDWSLIRGSLLLFGANLAGIVLSALLAFLLVGMYRAEVVEAARQWHAKSHSEGLTGQLEQVELFQRLRVFQAPWARVLLVLLFIGAMAFPLSSTLEQVVREARVQQAIHEAARQFEVRDRSFIISRNVTMGERSTNVQLRVATTEWIGPEQRHAFETAATARAREPVTLDIEQVPTEANLLDALATNRGSRSEDRPPTPANTISILQAQIADALRLLTLPDSVFTLGTEVAVSGARPHVRIAYAAPEPLPLAAEAMLTRQAARVLDLDPVNVQAEFVSLAAQPIPQEADALRPFATLLRRYAPLRLAIVADSALATTTQQRLRDLGAPASQVGLRARPGPSHLRFTIAPADSAR